jgi:hypothetical protein
VPAVVHHVVLVRGLLQVYLDQGLSHVYLL